MPTLDDLVSGDAAPSNSDTSIVHLSVHADTNVPMECSQDSSVYEFCPPKVHVVQAEVHHEPRSPSVSCNVTTPIATSHTVDVTFALISPILAHNFVIPLAPSTLAENVNGVISVAPQTNSPPVRSDVSSTSPPASINSVASPPPL